MYKEPSKILIAAHRLEPSNGCSRPWNTSGKKHQPQLIAIIVPPPSALNNKKEGVIE
ncbi:MAG: hypothetical protein WAM14_23795 [Candidatus Nitrosopolaris sp.]